jgi:hypothetical protein
VGAVVSATAACSLSVAAPVALGAHPRTVATLFEPFGAGGTPTIRVTHASGHCWTGSIASPRSDAWRCFEGANLILDPCFSSRAVSGEVVCPSIGMHSGAELKLTRGLPRRQANKAKPSLRDRPFDVGLAGGRHCVFVTGATSVIGAQRLNYLCNGRGHLGLWGFPDRHRQPWTIESAPDTASRLRSRVAIVDAWS